MAAAFLGACASPTRAGTRPPKVPLKPLMGAGPRLPEHGPADTDCGVRPAAAAAVAMCTDCELAGICRGRRPATPLYFRISTPSPRTTADDIDKCFPPGPRPVAGGTPRRSAGDSASPSQHQKDHRRRKGPPPIPGYDAAPEPGGRSCGDWPGSKGRSCSDCAGIGGPLSTCWETEDDSAHTVMIRTIPPEPAPSFATSVGPGYAMHAGD